MKRLKISLQCCVAFVLFIQIALSQEPARLEVGEPTPTFFLRSLDGANFFLSKEIKTDSPIILAFYATWCVPCRQEIVALEKMMADQALKTTRLYYVNVGGLMAADEGGHIVKQREEAEKIIKHKEQFNMTHSILMDRYALTAQKFGAESLPTLVVIGGDGNIKYLHHGYMPGDDMKIMQLIKDL